jgi:hypothetical protein
MTHKERIRQSLIKTHHLVDQALKRIRLIGSKAAPRSIQITAPVDAFIRK